MKRISSRKAVKVCLFAGLALAAAHLASDSRVQATPPPRCTPNPRAWYQQPTSEVRPNSILLFDNDSLRGSGNDFHLTKVTEYRQNRFHSLDSTSISNRMTSLKWHLPPGVIVVLYEDPDPDRPGRQYVIWGSGQDVNVSEEGFNDRVSGWAWFCVR